MTSYIDPSFRESILKKPQDRTAQVSIQYDWSGFAIAALLITLNNKHITGLDTDKCQLEESGSALFTERDDHSKLVQDRSLC